MYLNKRFKHLLNGLKGKLKNIEAVTIHTLRRTFISHMVMNGTDPMKVMTIVGHQDYSTMKRYLHLSPEYKANGANALPY